MFGSLGGNPHTMLSKSSLRILIITDLLLVALSIVVGIMGQSSLPEPLRAYEQAQSEAEMMPREWIVVGVGIPLSIAMLVASIGLMAFWEPARPLYLATVVVAILLTPLAGPYISSGWAQAIDGASLTITGVVLAIVYFSPLSDLYVKPKNVIQ